MHIDKKRVSTSPTPWGTNGAFLSLAERGLHQPTRFSPVWPYGVKCAYWCWSFVLPRWRRFT